MAKVANPQGKGTTLLNNHWYPNIQLQPKNQQEVLSDFLLSSLVLSAQFQFKPVPDTPYTLYLWCGELRLSLIPQEKCHFTHVEWLGDCQLRHDLTWQVQLNNASHLSIEAQQFLADFIDRFKEHLEQDKSMAELLPVYEASLPFYRRLYASGLAKSMGYSLDAMNLLDKKATALLTGVERLTLPGIVD